MTVIAVGTHQAPSPQREGLLYTALVIFARETGPAPAAWLALSAVEDIGRHSSCVCGTLQLGARSHWEKSSSEKPVPHQLRQGYFS